MRQCLRLRQFLTKHGTGVSYEVSDVSTLTHTHRGKQTNKQTNKQANKQTNKKHQQKCEEERSARESERERTQTRERERERERESESRRTDKHTHTHTQTDAHFARGQLLHSSGLSASGPALNCNHQTHGRITKKRKVSKMHRDRRASWHEAWGIA